MMTQDEMNREVAVGRDKFLELLAKHAGPVKDDVREVAERAFDAGAQWGLALAIRASGVRVPRWVIDALTDGAER